MKIFGLSDIGKHRQENQDCFAFEQTQWGMLAAVCDGMGGAAAGAVASSITCRHFISHAAAAIEAGGGRGISQGLRSAADYANRTVYSAAVENSSYRGMGSTLVAMLASDSRVFLLNIGDSRAYRISGSSMQQLTHDHSYVQELVDSGEITPEQALHHPRRNIITRVVGGGMLVRSDTFESAAEPGDIFLLCSDGLTNALDESHILQLCRSESEPEAICSKLIQAALAADARDNITAVILTYTKEAAQNEQ